MNSRVVIPRPGRGARAAAAMLAAAVAYAALTTAAAHALARPGSRPAAAPAWRTACAPARPGRDTCFTLWRPQQQADRALAAGQTARPRGWTPAQLRAAYKLPATSPATAPETVAVSIAFSTPTLAADLATYRREFGLPPCTIASGCLRIVNQQGTTSPAAPSGVGTGWDLEATLDVSMISAACPHCEILVVEASSDTTASLAASEDTAAQLGAQVISNSYGTPENGQAQTFASHYDHPGHMIVAATGDSGYGPANFPANLTTVIAVSGTELAKTRNPRGYAEQAWNQSPGRQVGGAGASGCSAYVPKPSWQHDPDCPGRTVADVSAIASDIPIYNPTYGGWVTVAGTSASAPFIAGIYGLAGNAATQTAADLYQHPAGFFDITRGNNVVGFTPAQACDNTYICAARKGYDAPTGLGTPNGISSF
jgi:Subtilase family